MYFEYWSEDNDIRYFIGINITTGEDIYFGDDKIKVISALKTTYHASKIITDDKNEDHVFTINLKNYYLERIDLKSGNFSYKNIEKIFNISVDSSHKPASRNSIIKLKDGNYLLSCIICKKNFLLRYHNLYLKIFNFDFTKTGMNGLNIVKSTDPVTDSFNTSTCFQTESGYLQCSYNTLYGLADYLTVGVYDLDLKEKFSNDTKTSSKNFSYLLHVKNEVGAYIYFNDNEKENIPKIILKRLNDNKEEFTDIFNTISLEFKNEFTFNEGLFYSDGIKINDGKFAFFLSSLNLEIIVICLFDLYNNDKTLRIRYFKLPLKQINIQISVNIRAFIFGNFLGLSFYDSTSEYPAYTIFNFPNFKNNNNYINNTSIEIKLFTDSSSYSFSLSENIILSNNIFGGEITGIKINNFPDKLTSGIIIKSSSLNKVITKNTQLNIDDQLIFEPFITGAIPGKYTLYFSTILKEADYQIAESFSDLTNYVGETSNYESQTFTGNVLRIIYIVDCKEECKSCSRLNTDTNFYCVRCKDKYSYFFSENSECRSGCNDYIIINGEIQYCNKSCSNGNYIYEKNENKTYCYENCENSQLIYVDNGIVKYCYDNCKEGQFIYEIGNEKYCIDNCESDQYVYENEAGETYCCDNCKDNQFIITKNDKKYCIDNCDIDKFV